MHKGYPNCCATSFPSKKLLAVAWGAIGTSISPMSLRKASLFSVMSMALVSTPIIRTLCSSQMPISSHWMARFNAVWPPIVGNTASMFGCFSRMFTIDSGSSGSR